MWGNNHFDLTPIVICNALYWNLMYNPLMVLAYIALHVQFFPDIYIQTWRWPSQVAETCSWYGYLCYRIQLYYDWYIPSMIVTLTFNIHKGGWHISTLKQYMLRPVMFIFPVQVSQIAWSIIPYLLDCGVRLWEAVSEKLSVSRWMRTGMGSIFRGFCRWEGAVRLRYLQFTRRHLDWIAWSLR